MSFWHLLLHVLASDLSLSFHNLLGDSSLPAVPSHPFVATSLVLARRLMSEHQAAAESLGCQWRGPTAHCVDSHLEMNFTCQHIKGENTFSLYPCFRHQMCGFSHTMQFSTSWWRLTEFPMTSLNSLTALR